MKKLLVKGLSFGLHKKGGRNNGTISVPRRGAIVKRLYRFIDTHRVILPGIPGFLFIRSLYDPNRSAKIALILYPNGILAYILSANYTAEQETVLNLNAPVKRKDKGWSNYLKLLPSGTIIFNLELIPGLGGKYSRAAGNSVLLLRNDPKFKNHVLIKLKSGEHRLISNNSIASVGIVSNHQHFLRNYKKAGVIRRFGIRPRVRPFAMNPVDHPMAGRTKGGCQEQNRNGKLTLGISTRHNKNINLILLTRRQTKIKRLH